MFTIIFGLICLPYFLLILSLCALYRKCVDMFLRAEFTENYAGLLIGNDASWTIEDNISKSVCTLLILVERNNKNTQNFYKTVKNNIYQRVFANPTISPKCSGIFKIAYGYTYLLKNQYHVNDCVREFNREVKNRQDLQQILNDYANVPLPKNHSAFWEVLVGKEAIQWKNDDTRHYPVLFRFQHSMMDGMNLFSFLQTILNENNTIQTHHLEKDKENKPFLSSIKFYFHHLYMMILIPHYVLSELLFRREDSHELYGKTLSGKKILVWRSEERQILDKVKKLKKAVPKASFLDILITAVSASFEDYFNKYCLKTPDAFTLGYPISSSNVGASKVGQMQKCNFINEFAGSRMSTPIVCKTKSFSKRLEEVCKRRELDSIEVIYWCINTLSTYLPRGFNEVIKKNAGYTVTLSNIPGPSYMTMFNGCHVDTMLGWVPHYHKIGMGIVITTYGQDGMQLTLSVDEALIDSVEKANSILDGVSKHIDVMYKELCGGD